MIESKKSSKTLNIKNEDQRDIKISGSCYKIFLETKTLLFWNTSGLDTRNIMIQLESEQPFTLPFFIVEQAKRWERDEVNIFEALLSFLIIALTEKAEKIQVSDNVDIEAEQAGDLGDITDHDKEEERDDLALADQKDSLDIADHLVNQHVEVNNDENKENQEKEDKNDIDKLITDDMENVVDTEDAYSKLELDLKEEVEEIPELDNPALENLAKLKGIKVTTIKSTTKKSSNQNSGGKAAKSKEKKLKCQECDAWFTGAICLKTHIQTIHLNIRNFRCNICKKEYSTLTMIKRHMKTVHQDNEEDYIYLKKEREEKENRFCEDCEEWCESSDQLIDHVISQHPTKPDLLPYMVRKRGPLPWSRTDVWERPDWTCPLCTEEPIYRTDAGADGMVGHVRIFHPDNLLCWVCGLAFNTSQGKKIFAHMKELHPLKSVFACSECGLYNRTKKLLTSHNKLHAKKGTSLLQCDECNYTTLRTDLLKIHQKIHVRPDENKAKLVCDECGGLFKSKPAHRKHVKIFHSKTEGFHACTECNKKFFQRYSLLEHMNVHKGTKSYSCEFCAQTFAMCSSLTKHRKRKHGELIGKYPEHSCLQCHKKFWQPKELKTHVDREHNRK